MKKKKITLLVTAILALSLGFQLNAQSYRFTAIQDTILMHCNDTARTTVHIVLSDPNDELTGPFTVQWTVNQIVQSEAGFVSTDTLQWRDTVVYEVFDATSTSVWLDSLLIRDAGKPDVMIYPGYQRPSHACYGTGRTKLQVPWPYKIENISILDGTGNEKIEEGNHAIIDSISGGNHQMRYSINACTYYYEFYIDELPKPDLKMDQLYLATCNDGKYNLMLSDSMIIDSVWLYGRDEMYSVGDTSYHLHVPGGEQEIEVYAKNCDWYNSFFVESESDNVLKVVDISTPHENVSTGEITISSDKEIKEAIVIDENGDESIGAFSRYLADFNFLDAGDYVFKIKDKNSCWTEIPYSLESINGNPIPTGFSVDSVFDFKIDGVPINDVPEIGNQYNLIIMKQLGNMSFQEVFNSSNGDILPWDKKMNGVQTGYFLYNLEVTNPNYKGKNPIKSYFRIYPKN